MRIPEKYQELYFFLQDIESRLHELDRENDLRKNNNKELDNIDKDGISLVHEIKRLLNDIHEFSPYNDMESIWGESTTEIKKSIENRFNSLEKMVSGNK